MKKSIFTLLALAIASVSVFTSCEGDTDYDTSVPSAADNTNKDSGSSEGSEAKNKADSVITYDVKFTAYNIEMTFLDYAPEGAEQQFVNVMKNFIQKQIGKLGVVEASYENNNMSLVIYTTKNLELNIKTMINAAAYDATNYRAEIAKLGYVKYFTMRIQNCEFYYKLNDDYQGKWECTDLRGNTYTMIVSQSTAEPIPTKTYDVQMTCNGVVMKTTLTNNVFVSVPYVDYAETGSAAKELAKKGLQMNVTEYSSNKMIVKIVNYFTVVDPQAEFTKVK